MRMSTKASDWASAAMALRRRSRFALASGCEGGDCAMAAGWLFLRMPGAHEAILACNTMETDGA